MSERDKPILFSGPMVRALLDRRKTQTRRLIKPPRGWGDRYPHYRPGVLDNGLWFWDGVYDRVGCSAPMPYAVGDRLWVRKQFAIGNPQHKWGSPIYRASFGAMLDPTCEGFSKWRPSIHMPRWASRLTLTVTDVRVQRLQDISEEDALAEGVEAVSLADVPRQATWTLRQDFAALWNSLHGPDAWQANPWVVALSFSVAKHNIDAPEVPHG